LNGKINGMKKIIILINVLFMAFIQQDFAQGAIYLPLGDSYTICEGLAENERWPNLIVDYLNKEDLKITLAGNPSRTGYTTNDLIKKELPVLKTTTPDIVTLLIGVNDYVQGYDTSHFHKNLKYILSEIESVIKTKTNIILIAIPDYSVTPEGAYYAGGRDVASDLKIWNSIIEKEAKNRKLPFIDIFPTTQKMGTDASLVSSDGLHPSAKEVALWAVMIYPELKRMVKALQ
jgi:lysophospholipase L1-like esterase